MATITNRSHWALFKHGSMLETYKKKAEALASLALVKDKKGMSVAQLEDRWQVQIRLRDGNGNEIRESKNFGTLERAKEYAKQEEDSYKSYLDKHGNYDIALDTARLEYCLNRVIKEHYEGMACHYNHTKKVPKICAVLGKNTLIKDLKIQQWKNYRDGMENAGYSNGSINDYFSLISQMYKWAKSEWLLDIKNPIEDLLLKKPKGNEIQRYWEDDNEKERLYESIRKNRPWLEDIVSLSLELSFRRGELIPPTLLERDKNEGLMWEGVDFKERTIRLFKEKNDHTKNLSREVKGRTVPMTKRVEEILYNRWIKEGQPKRGRVFNASGNSVTHAFKEVCELATPPITNLTFHSMRKCATINLAKVCPDPIILSRFTGHKSLDVLATRYYKLPVKEMRIYADQLSLDDYRLKCLLAMEKIVGREKTIEFLNWARSAEINNEYRVIEELEELTKQKAEVKSLKLVRKKKG